MLIPQRKPRPFSGSKGESIKELYSATIGNLGIIDLNSIDKTVSERYNTQAWILTKAKTTAGLPEETKRVLYNRLTISEVFSRASLDDGTGFQVEANEEVQHPLTTDALIKLLNGKYHCDFDSTDIIATYINGNVYTVSALVKSLGYIGEAELHVGSFIEVPKKPTEHALLNTVISLTEASVNPTINGLPVDIDSTTLFSEVGVIFQEFDLAGKKLSYLLNTRPVSLNLVVNTPVDPATNNLNETVQPSTSTFILSEFIPSVVNRVTNEQRVPYTFAITTWLDSIAELDAIFNITANNVATTFAALTTANPDFTVEYTAGKLQITNLKYVDHVIKLHAKTVSLPAIESPALSFLKVNNVTSTLISGYESYEIVVAAAAVPLTPLVFEHYVPTSNAQYRSMLEKAALTIGVPPSIERNQLGTIIAINRLNLNADTFETYRSITTVTAANKVINGNVGLTGLKYLDVFRIPRESWERLHDGVSLNTPLLTVERKALGKATTTATYSFNELQQRGMLVNGDFIIILNGTGNWDGETVFSYPEVADRHASGINTLVTTRNFSDMYSPKLELVSPDLWAAAIVAKPELTTQFGNAPWNDGHQTTTLVGNNDIIGDLALNFDLSPKFSEINEGKVNYHTLMALTFNADTLAILDYAVADLTTPTDVELNSSIVNFALGAIAPANQSLTPVTLTLGEFIANRYNKFYLDPLTNKYYAFTQMKVTTDLAGIVMTDGKAVINESLPLARTTFDADSVVGEVFETFEGATQITVTATLKPASMSPVRASVPWDLTTLVPIFQNSVNGIPNYVMTDHHIRSLTSQVYSVNVKEDDPSHFGLIELMLNLAEFDTLSKVGKFQITRNGVLVPNFDLLANFKFVMGRCLMLVELPPKGGDVVYDFVIDADASGPFFIESTSTVTFSVTAIPAPQDIFMLLDTQATAADQLALVGKITPPSQIVTTPNPNSNVAFGRFVTNPIKNLMFNTLNPVNVVDGYVDEIDVEGVIGLEFKVFELLPTLQGMAKLENVLGSIAKLGTVGGDQEIYRDNFRTHTYEKLGESYIFIPFVVNATTPLNGNYVINIDWDGLGTDDTYLIDGSGYNNFYQQRLEFTLDLETSYLPRDLESVRCFWYGDNITVNAELANPLSTVYPRDYPAADQIPVADLDITVVGNSATTKVFQDPIDPTKLYTLLIETDLTDDIVTNWLPSAAISMTSNGITVAITPAEFQASLYRSDVGVYFLRQGLGAEAYSTLLTIDIDLDADGTRYKRTISNLEIHTIVETPTVSPTFTMVTDQRTLLELAKAGTINIHPNDPTFVYDATYIDPAEVVYATDITGNPTISISSYDPTVPKACPIFLEYGITDEQYATLLNAKSSVTFVNSHGGVVLPTILEDDGIMFKERVFQHAGKYYVAFPAYPNGGLQSEFTTSLDWASKYWKVATGSLQHGYSFEILDSKAGPTIVFAPNQRELLVLAEANTIKLDPLDPLTDYSVNFAATADIVIEGTALGSTTTTVTNAQYEGGVFKQYPAIFEFNATEEHFLAVNASSVLKIAVRNTSTNVVQNLQYTGDQLKAKLFTHLGKRYFIHPVASNEQLSFTLEFDIDGAELTWSTSTYNHIVNYNAVTKVTQATPMFRLAVNQNELYSAFVAGTLTMPFVAYDPTLHCATMESYSPSGTNENAWFNSATLNQDQAALGLVAFLEYAGTEAEWNELNTSGSINMIFTSGDVTEVTTSSAQLLATTALFGGKRYVGYNIKPSTVTTLAVTVDNDAAGLDWAPSTANYTFEFRRNLREPTASPRVVLPANYVNEHSRAVSSQHGDLDGRPVVASASLVSENDVAGTTVTVTATVKPADAGKSLIGIVTVSENNSNWNNKLNDKSIVTTTTVVNTAAPVVVELVGKTAIMEALYGMNNPNQYFYMLPGDVVVKTFLIDYDGDNPNTTPTTSILTYIYNETILPASESGKFIAPADIATVAATYHADASNVLIVDTLVPLADTTYTVNSDASVTVETTADAGTVNPTVVLVEYVGDFLENAAGMTYELTISSQLNPLVTRTGSLAELQAELLTYGTKKYFPYVVAPNDTAIISWTIDADGTVPNFAPTGSTIQTTHLQTFRPSVASASVAYPADEVALVTLMEAGTINPFPANPLFVYADTFIPAAHYTLTHPTATSLEVNSAVPSALETKAVPVIHEVLITAEQVAIMTASNGTITLVTSVGALEPTTRIITAAQFNAEAMVHAGRYFLVSALLANSPHNYNYAVDFDAAVAKYEPTVSTLSATHLMTVDAGIVCDGALNESTRFKMVDGFSLDVNEVVLESQPNQDDLVVAVNAAAHPVKLIDDAVVVDNWTANATGPVTLEGTWDVEVGYDKVVENGDITAIKAALGTDYVNGVRLVDGNSEGPKPGVPLEPEFGMMVKMTEDTRYNLTLDNVLYANLDYNQLRKVLDTNGVDLSKLVKV